MCTPGGSDGIANSRIAQISYEYVGLLASGSPSLRRICTWFLFSRLAYIRGVVLGVKFNIYHYAKLSAIAIQQLTLGEMNVIARLSDL